MKLVKGNNVFNTDNTNLISAYMEAGYVEAKEAPKAEAKAEPKEAPKASKKTK